MNTTENHDARPILRPLPAGHENPKSAYWIKPEHRDEYQRVPELSGDQLSKAIAEHIRRLDHQDDLATWQAQHDKVKQTRADQFHHWLRENTHDDGRPRLFNVRDWRPERPMVPAPGGGMMDKPRELNGAETKQAEHYAYLMTAAQTVRERAAERKAEAQRRLRYTCTACGAVDLFTAPARPAGVSKPMCSKCRHVWELLSAASENVPTGGTRLDVLQKLIPDEPGPDTDTEATPPPAAETPRRSGLRGLIGR